MNDTLKVAIATSNVTNESYNGGFSSEFSVSMLKETYSQVHGSPVLETLSFESLDIYVKDIRNFFTE